MEENLLKGSFQMLPACSTLYDVSVTRLNIMFKETTGRKSQRLTSILFENIIGSKMFESRISTDASFYFQFIALIKNKKGIRQKQTFTFRIIESKDKQENATIAETWARTVAWLIRNPSISIAELEEKDEMPPPKKFFVMINPRSGPGKSLQIFTNVIEPLLLAANVRYKTLITEYAGHCKKIATTFDYKEWDAVIICSGDGLAHEYINGIMCRPDWKDCLQLPIGILPTGSGNALSASILHSAKETLGSVVNAVYVTLKGVSCSMDLFSIQTSKQRLFGFLSLTWGIVSDVDIESEKYRALGEFRFTIGALKRVLSLRHYKGKFSYLIGEKIKNMAQGIDALESNSVNKISNNGNINSIKSSAVVAGQDVQVNEIDSFHEVASAVKNNDGIAMKNVIYGPEMTLPPLTTDVPLNWKSIEDEFVYLTFMSITHLSTNNISSPNSFFNDGVLNVQVVRKGITKRNLIGLLTDIEKGKHLEYTELEELQIKAFRLELDLQTIGNIAVDGELIDYELVQGEIFPSLANILMIPLSGQKHIQS